MGVSGGPDIIQDGLVFAWNGTDENCWNGSSTAHTELIRGNTGNKLGANSLALSGSHVYFTGGGDRVCTINYSSSLITVPTGNTGTWMWAQYFVDSGNRDHPNFGKEIGSGWNGTGGFVFGTGWGLDGPRWGIGGQYYQVYPGDNSATYKNAQWQVYCVTYTRNTVDGLKTYLMDSQGTRLADAQNTSDLAISSSAADLVIGATNIRGGNWQGYMDFVYMWNIALDQNTVYDTFNIVKNRFGLK
jgi:hypothetical protein